MIDSFRPRALLVALLVIALAAGMAVRLGYLQVEDRQFLQRQGDARTIRMERINAHRGVMQDRHGKPLAISTPVLSLWANPGEVLAAQHSTKQDSASTLSPNKSSPSKPDLAPLADYLGVTTDDFLARMAKAGKRSFVYVRRHLPPAEARRILSLAIPGIYAEREYRRYYPAGEVASHLVGFTDIDDRGQEGLELAFDAWLAGTPGKKKVVKNLHGEIIRDPVPVQEAVPGKNLRLAVDFRLQYLAYRELKSAVTHYKANAGSCVIVDVATGQVLAMVNQPSYNPNNRTGLNMAALRNRALTDAFEPGSTVKPFTAAVALGTNNYTPETIIDTSPGALQVGSFVVEDPRNRGVMTLEQVIAHSSQVGISKLALELDEYEVWKLFRSLGFGQETGLTFPGESLGYLPQRRRWSDIDRVTLAYGYGLAATPVQLASAYLTIASGGMRRELSLLSARTGEATQVLPPHLAQQLKLMLAKVVQEGTGRKAAIPGYQIAGKTGTVRKLGEGGYRDNEHLAFFAGMAPLDNPRLVAVVLIDEPKTIQSGGGAVAAPVFSRVMSAALRILNVIPTRIGAA
ncbi:MAG: peptidoglycan D,D-transpeptidase FtsI family protein [Pseudomonadales bacterium]